MPDVCQRHELVKHVGLIVDQRDAVQIAAEMPVAGVEDVCHVF